MRWRWCSVGVVGLLAAMACEQKRKTPQTRPVAKPVADAAPDQTDLPLEQWPTDGLEPREETTR